MSCGALLSCLGVSGWGPLHWWLRCDGEPPALLQRLRLAWRHAEAGGAPDPRAPLLLASLLRTSTDLLPLSDAPLPPLQAGLFFRHRLSCRPGEPWLHLRSWQCRSALLPWRCCGLEQRLDAKLLSRSPACVAAAVPRLSPPPLQAHAEDLYRPALAVLRQAAEPRAGRWS